MLSTSPLVPQTMLSTSSCVPQTMLSSCGRLVPHTTLSQLAPAHCAPQTTFESDAIVPHTMFSPLSTVPQTMLSTSRLNVPQTMLSASSSDVPQTMLSQSKPHTVPHTMFSPLSRSAAPHVTPVAQAVPAGLITPPVSWWFPQMIVRPHGFADGYRCP